jgi:hypothetical protein
LDYWSDKGCRRIIELHSHDSDLGVVSLAISRPYHVLLAVNREARYETSKADGEEFITVKARYTSRRQTHSTAAFEVCVNFTRDTFLISNRFENRESRSRSRDEALPSTFVNFIDKTACALITQLHLVVVKAKVNIQSLPSLAPFQSLESLGSLQQTPRLTAHCGNVCQDGSK